MTWASGKKKGKIKLPKIPGPHSSYRGLFTDSLKLKCPFQEEPHVWVYRGAKSPPVLFPAKLISPPERITYKIQNKQCFFNFSFPLISRLGRNREIILLTCCESPLREVWLTRMMTSPTLMRPLSAAGWPGKSFLTRTMLEPWGSSGMFSSRLKLKPSPDVFFSRHTSNTLSMQTETRQIVMSVVYHRLKRVRCWN